MYLRIVLVRRQLVKRAISQVDPTQATMHGTAACAPRSTQQTLRVPQVTSGPLLCAGPASIRAQGGGEQNGMSYPAPWVHPAMRGVGVQGQAWPGGGTVTGPPSSCAQGSWGLSQKPGSSVLDLMAKRKAWAKHSSNRIYSHIFTECRALC